MTTFKKMKYKILAGLMAAGMVLGTGAVTAFAVTDTSTASISFEYGNLKLLQVSSIDFGEGLVSSAEESYQSQDVTRIRVADDRGGSEGWVLNASLGTFEIGGTAALQGATINVGNAGINPLNGNTATAPAPNTNFTLTAGGAPTNVATADDGQGAGAWEVVWNADQTSLTVPAGTAREGDASAEILWSLEAVPAG